MALTETQAALIKGMLKRGDKQSDIAAWFGVTPGASLKSIRAGVTHRRKRRHLRYCRRRGRII